MFATKRPQIESAGSLETDDRGGRLENDADARDIVLVGGLLPGGTPGPREGGGAAGWCGAGGWGPQSRYFGSDEEGWRGSDAGLGRSSQRWRHFSVRSAAQQTFNGGSITTNVPPTPSLHPSPQR